MNTIKDLQSYGIKVSGENVDYEVPGAVIFGPKVGGGFYPNDYYTYYEPPFVSAHYLWSRAI